MIAANTENTTEDEEEDDGRGREEEDRRERRTALRQIMKPLTDVNHKTVRHTKKQT